MHSYLTDREIDQLLEEDVPCGDLTTQCLGIGDRSGCITFIPREEMVAGCIEEAGRLLEKAGCEVSRIVPSGTLVAPGEILLAASGSAAALHIGWKAALNILEYCGGIATRTRRIVAAARAVNPRIVVASTRKMFPGTRKLAVKAVVSGGGMAHRLGLSESILVFPQHTAFFGGLERFLSSLPELKERARETKVIVEVTDLLQAHLAAAAGADIIQVDKMDPESLSQVVQGLRGRYPGLTISAAGGIREETAAAYAAAGVDILVTSSVYFGRPADIGATIEAA